MTDPTIDEVRRARRVISAEFGPGLAGLVDRYAKMESRFSHAPLTRKYRRTMNCTEVGNEVDSATTTSDPPTQ